MFYCEDCRDKRKLNRPNAWPYSHMHFTVCGFCDRQKQCYEQPGFYLKPKKSWTQEEKQLDKILQHEYHSRCEEMVIAFASGAHAGAIDYQRTEALKQAVVKIDNEIDWYATFELRSRIQEGYRKSDELNRMKRG